MTKPQQNLVSRYGKKVVDVLTRPVSKTVQLYTTPAYAQQEKDKKNPKSPAYKKNLVDRFADRVMSPY